MFTLQRIIKSLKLRPYRPQRPISIEVMDGTTASHHLKVLQVVARIAPNSQIRFIPIAVPGDHLATIERAAHRVREIVASPRRPDILLNCWEFPRTPSIKDFQRYRWRSDINYAHLSYDQLRAAYPCHPQHPYTVLIREVAAQGIICIFAAGNRGLDRGPAFFPGRISGANGLPDVITVGAVDRRGAKKASSSYGPSTFCRAKPDVWAPAGYRINERLGYFHGTSAAAPIVAGLCARELSLHTRGLHQAQLLETVLLKYRQVVRRQPADATIRPSDHRLEPAPT